MLLKRKRENGLPQLDTNVYEITPYTFRKIEYPNRRMNLLVPSINAEHVFGGISTALKFFDTLVKALGYDARIILVDAEPDKAAIKKYSDEYTFVKAEDDSLAAKQIIPYSNLLTAVFLCQRMTISYLLAGGQHIVVRMLMLDLKIHLESNQIFFSILFRIMSLDFIPGLRSTCLQILPIRVIIQQLQFLTVCC